MIDTAQVDIKKYWQMIIERRYLFITVFLSVMSIIVWGSFFMPKIYRASSTVFIERNIIKKLVEGMTVTPSIEERLKIIQYSMQSREMLLKVIKALDLDVGDVPPGKIESMISNFRNETKINVRGRDLFIVSYKGKDPKLVRDYVNTLISIYVEENTSAKREETYGANQFLAEQISHYKKKMDEAEDRLTRFRNEKGLYYAIDEKAMVKSIREYKEEVENVNMRIRELQAKKVKIEQQISGEEPLTLIMLDSTKGGESSPLSQRLASLEQRLAVLLTKYTENYPEVIRIKAEMEQVRIQMDGQGDGDIPGDISDIGALPGMGSTSGINPVYQQLKEELFNTESEIDSLKAKAVTLQSRIRKQETELRNIPKEKKELANLERDRNTYQRIYEQLLGRLGQAEVSKQMELEDKGTNFRIVDPAIMPTSPVSPDRVLLILFGIVAGLAAGIGVILLLDFTDQSVKDIDTLKTEFKLPVLAVIPEIINDDDVIKTKRLDRTVYTVSLAYLSVIGALFIKELLGRF